MTCKETENLVMPYIKGELTDEELKGFLEHIEHCENCLEELEIYFTVDVGIKQLDSETGSYNIKGELQTSLEQSKLRLHAIEFRKIVRYAVSTLGVMGLILTFLLQCRIWMQQGIFR